MLFLIICWIIRVIVSSCNVMLMFCRVIKKVISIMFIDLLKGIRVIIFIVRLKSKLKGILSSKKLEISFRVM